MTSRSSMKVINSSRSPTLIDYKERKFVITEKPHEQYMLQFVEDLKKFNVKILVRVCDSKYETNLLEKNGISVVDLPFEDGSSPPKFIIDEWLKILKENYAEPNDLAIAVHCVSGLGRGPLLVAIALMELGLKVDESIEMIRSNRRGALNLKQLAFLESYPARKRLIVKRHFGGYCCFDKRQ